MTPTRSANMALPKTPYSLIIPSLKTAIFFLQKKLLKNPR